MGYFCYALGILVKNTHGLVTIMDSIKAYILELVD
jgi:hypothetical protein